MTATARELTHTVRFDERGADQHDLVGGKGANLGRLAVAGFTVPAGFTVTTDAYKAFLGEDLAFRLEERVARLDFTDQAAVDSGTAEIRALMVGAPMPEAAADAVRAAYRALGDSPSVAVRSSGTAEDLADASFAGLHDTFLHVRGADDVVDAVRRCWASMWSARAASYRQHNGFAHADARIAVVVQTMVDAQTSGVMFTGNPMNTATDEIVINASYGLGEAIVSGAVTPDLVVLNSRAMSVLATTIGTKEHRIDRDPERGAGTVTLDVEPAERARCCLTPEEIRALGELGLRVQEHYDGFPQDIEWAIVDGQAHVLQSRPITGVEFSWDADLELAYANAPFRMSGPTTVDDHELWTRAFADAVATGAISPMFYSYRFVGCSRSFQRMGYQLDLPQLVERNCCKFYKGEVYYNCRLDRDIVEKTGVPAFRAGLLSMLPPQWHDDVVASPFGIPDFVRRWLKAIAVERDILGFGLEGWMHRLRADPKIHGLPYEELELLSDTELKAYIDDLFELEFVWNDKCFLPLFIHFRDAVSTLAWIVGHWYDGPNPQAFSELMSGSTRSTATQVENAKIWELAQRIRHEPALLAAFERAGDGSVFADLEGFEVGRTWLAEYRAFLADYGHRGHADRDVIYKRRIEDPDIDYRTFTFLLREQKPVHPEEREHAVTLKRQAAHDDVVENIRRKPLGGIKAEAFKQVFAWTHRFILVRDDERWSPSDIVSYSYKRGIVELGRRLSRRGVLDADDDVYFLGRDEAFGLLDGDTRRLRLMHAKAAARRRDYQRFLRREVSMPMYLRDYDPVDLDAPPVGDDPNSLIGTGTAPGEITATARVIHHLEDIGRISPGEILVTNSTDPGWTPVFLALSSVVVETGGLLSHSSCLAREYGLPAVQLAGATRSIPDGATITVNGNTGVVTLVQPRCS